MYTKKEVLDDVFSVISTYKSCEFKVYKQHGKYSENTIDRFFGNWTNLLEQNGITPPHRRNVRKEEVISDVKKVFRETNNTKQENYIKYGKFSRSIIKRHFGSWNKMLMAMGISLNMHKPGQYSKESIIKNYCELKKDFGRPFSATEYRRYGRFSQPIIDRVFGSFSNLKKELDERIDARFLSDEDALQEIKSLLNEYGFLTEQILTDNLKCISYPTILARFGSLLNLCKLVGAPMDIQINHRQSKFALQCIQNIRKIFGNNLYCEVTFPWLRNPKTNRALYLDMFYPEHGLAFEFDGLQHRKITRFSKTNENLKISNSAIG